MDHNQTETTIVSSNATKSLFYCPHAPRLIWDVHDTISPWIFAAVASIISPAAVLLNALVIIAVTKRRELQKPSNILLSSMAVTDLLVGAISIPLSAIDGFLLPIKLLLLNIFARSTWQQCGSHSLWHFVRCSIWCWLHGRDTWPFENGGTTEIHWLKAD